MYKMAVLLSAELIKTETPEKVLEALENLTKLCQDSEKRSSFDSTNFVNLSTFLERLLKNEVPKSTDELLVETYRFLRNSVASCPKNQDVIREETNIISWTKEMLENSCTCSKEDKDELSEKRLLAIRCSLQFLANFMVDNANNIALISSSFPGILGELMNTFRKDEKIIQYAAMIVHLGLKQTPREYYESPKILKALFNSLQLEFVIYSVESLVKLEAFAEVYETLEPEDRIKALTFLNARPDILKSLNEKVVKCLKTNFVERSDFILMSKIGDRDNTFCWEIAVILEVLCALSAEENQLLQTDSTLLTTVLCLLRQIHEAGKTNSGIGAGGNVFSPVEDLAKLTSKSVASKDDENDIRAHPTFQFKAHLIRLIANLGHRNKPNQDKVRDLECLPIILDNCKLDARNPFIGQWSVLAIRNLCEGNPENQAYIREVQRIDTEKLLPQLELIDLS